MCLLTFWMNGFFCPTLRSELREGRHDIGCSQHLAASVLIMMQPVIGECYRKDEDDSLRGSCCLGITQCLKNLKV